MRKLRGHLEQALPLDLELRVHAAGDRSSGGGSAARAQRNEAGQPVYLAGSVREVSAARTSRARPRVLAQRVRCTAGGGGAARRDAHAPRSEPQVARVSAGHRRAGHRAAACREQSDGDRVLAGHGRGASAGVAALRVRAIAFQHDGARHLVVTLEDRRTN